ncbi:hypothetical protein HYDPIDRAFT_106275 [Hydnomerulius pinastri MD-312]|nr:hypothetical protein HYDPIDRAFT_106275 [Hydnomerulius pinastri MD-312]
MRSVVVLVDQDSEVGPSGSDRVQRRQTRSRSRAHPTSMSYKSRKRRRSRAFPVDEDEQPVAIVDEDQPAQDSVQADESEELTEERKKELEVWESFKEEHHEVLEQLPLSLHRQYKLMRELDTQSEAFHADLLTSVRTYIALRKSLAPRIAEETAAKPPEGSSPKPIDTDLASVEQSGNASPSTMAIDETEPTQNIPPVNSDTRASTTTPVPQASNNDAKNTAPFTSKPGETTRTLLQHISQTSEETLRTAEEKVSIAQTAYETVDRHIRLLDQAIKEQEAAISLGMRPGTHLAPILLPDLVVPRWARPSRVEHSPVPSLSPEPSLLPAEVSGIAEPPEAAAASLKVTRRGRKPAARGTQKDKAEPEPQEEPLAPPAEDQELVELPRTRRSGVRLTIPAQFHPAGPAVPGDSNEARYCYCHQVSYGTMIGCDNEACKLEWFHLGCTGLSEVPNKKTKWYCRECKPKMAQRGRPARS